MDFAQFSPRNAMLCSVLVIVILSVSLSVCLRGDFLFFDLHCICKYTFTVDTTCTSVSVQSKAVQTDKAIAQTCRLLACCLPLFSVHMKCPCQLLTIIWLGALLLGAAGWAVSQGVATQAELNNGRSAGLSAGLAWLYRPLTVLLHPWLGRAGCPLRSD